MGCPNEPAFAGLRRGAGARGRTFSCRRMRLGFAAVKPLVAALDAGGRAENCRRPRGRFLYTGAMPELPEVETVVRGLARSVVGEVIESVWVGSKPEPAIRPLKP